MKNRGKPSEVIGYSGMSENLYRFARHLPRCCPDCAGMTRREMSEHIHRLIARVNELEATLRSSGGGTR